MTTENPTQPEVPTAVIGLAIHLRKTIDTTDRANPHQVATKLDAIHEHLALTGGSVTMLAEELGQRQKSRGPRDREPRQGQSLRVLHRAEGPRMSSVRLTDGRVLHIPVDPLVLDTHSVIMAPADAALAELVPLIPDDDLLLFTGRLVTGARKRRRQPRYAEVNAARLKLARFCIDRALTDWQEVQA